MPLQLNKHQLAQLNLDGKELIELDTGKKIKGKKTHKPSVGSPQQRDRADILAIWLPRHGIEVISEIEYTRRVERGIYVPPVAVREFHFARPWRDFRSDLAFPDLRIGIECDGGNHMIKYDRHGNPYAAGHHIDDDDYVKRNMYAQLFYRVLFYTTNQLESAPLQCVEQILAVLKGELPPL